MKAIGFYEALPSENTESLIDFETEKPTAQGRDLLVKVEAVSVNPVDTKVRRGQAERLEKPRILGWDAVGVVEAVGSNVTLFAPGDEVFYAGDITRAGSNAEWQLVDERIVAKKPKSLDAATAASLPLTAITAWEGLHDRLGISKDGGDAERTLLVINGAGGVGSIVIQLAKMAGLTVIATASRAETRAWVEELGADHVISHRESLIAQLREQGVGEVDFIYNADNVDRHWQGMVEAIRPQGRIVGIANLGSEIDLSLLQPKSAIFAWELMFTRPMFETDDMIEQHHLLTEVARAVDDGRLRATAKEQFGAINASNLRRAHAKLESGTTIGKIVLAGFEA